MSIVASLVPVIIGVVVFIALPIIVIKAIGITFVRPDEIGLIEKIWSKDGASQDGVIALNNEAGIQPIVLRAGLHFKPRWIFRVYKYPLVTIGSGAIGYIFARDGVPLRPEQTLGKAMPLETYLDVRAFIEGEGQKGAQRSILREGTYAINPALFVVITQSETYYHPLGDDDAIEEMASKIAERKGFEPVVIDGAADKCGIVTVHDGPSLPLGDLIAPPVGGTEDEENYHNNFQDPEKFLAAGGFRGRQYPVLSDGTYYINRLFATVELIDKSIVPVGEVGVVVSYFGTKGTDTSGADFTHGELVKVGEKGIWVDPLMPGKYAFNTYAGKIASVPTTNIILKWIKGQSGDHNYDSDLAEVGLITKDAFEPLLPLQVVIHIDYKKAPFVIQRFGDIGVLVNQSLDPLVSSYFKNIAQLKTIIELIQQRGEIQKASSEDMKARFAEYNLELAEVLIGTPRSPEGDDRIETILNQLRDRQLAQERLETYDKQKVAAEKERELKEAEAVALQQTALTESAIKIKVQENQGAAELAKAQQDATKIKVTAEAEASRVRQAGQADADRVRMMGEAQADATARNGIAEGIAIQEQVDAYAGRPELKLASEIVPKIAQALADGEIQLVPSTLIQMGGADGQSADGTALLTALIAGKVMGVPFDAPSTSGTVPEKKDRSPQAEKIHADLLESANTDKSKDTATEQVPAIEETLSTEAEPSDGEADKTGRKPRHKGADK